MALPTENEMLAPETWGRLNEHLSNRVLEVAKAQKNGTKVVGVFPGDWVPEELIHACKAIPLGLILGGEPDTLDIAHTMLPRFICAFVRAACGYRKTGGLVLAFNEEERLLLEDLLKNGKKNGVRDLEIIKRKRILELEPNI